MVALADGWRDRANGLLSEQEWGDLVAKAPVAEVEAVLRTAELLHRSELVTEDEIRTLVAAASSRPESAVRLAVAGLLGAVRAGWAVAELDRFADDRELAAEVLELLAENRHPLALARLRARASSADPFVAEMAALLARRREGGELAEAVRAGSGPVESLQIRALVGYERYAEVWLLLQQGRVIARDLSYLRDLPEEVTGTRGRRRLLHRIRARARELDPGGAEFDSW